jgi:hypothetical protein
LSDYDFGVLLDQSVDSLAYRVHLTHAFVTSLGADRIDIIVLNDAPIELAYAVIEQGYQLYQRNIATRVEYEAQVMSLYGDYLPVLRAQRDQLLYGEDDGARIQRYREAFRRTERTLSQITTAAKQVSR